MIAGFPVCPSKRLYGNRHKTDAVTASSLPGVYWAAYMNDSGLWYALLVSGLLKLLSSRNLLSSSFCGSGYVTVRPIIM